MGRKSVPFLHPSVFLWNTRKVFVLNGRPVGTRTPDLYRVNVPKDNNLDRIERHLAICFARKAAKNHGEESQVPRCEYLGMRGVSLLNSFLQGRPPVQQDGE
jgi:hypothetical protein